MSVEEASKIAPPGRLGTHPRVSYRTSPNEVASCYMADPLRRKDFAYGVVVTPFDEAIACS